MVSSGYFELFSIWLGIRKWLLFEEFSFLSELSQPLFFRIHDLNITIRIVTLLVERFLGVHTGQFI